MKILVFADFHGSVGALGLAAEISSREKPDKTVVCGDLFGWNSPSDVAEETEKLCGVLYLVKGNNDWLTERGVLPCEMSDNVPMYHFGRTLFFTHGDRYNAMRIPPLLKEGDVLVYGHTHMGRLWQYNGIFVCNVGSLARPRDGMPCYLVLDECGAALFTPDGKELSHMNWQ